jgi:hypothetical protein
MRQTEADDKKIRERLPVASCRLPGSCMATGKPATRRYLPMIRTFVMTRTILALLFALGAVAEPRVTSINPSSGPVQGGTYVAISGVDLNGFALACPALECATYVQFGGAMGTIVTTFDKKIVVITPEHAEGSVDVIVNVAGKAKVTIPNGFRYELVADTDMVRLLIPIASSGPGAFESQWSTDLAIHNASDEIVYPEGPFCNPYILAPCIQYFIGPHTTGHHQLYPIGQPGAFLYLSRRLADNIDVQLRVQDLSRQSQTWGTAIPVVRDADFRGIVRLHAIPTDSRFRDTLRIYGYVNGGVAKVRILDETTGALIASTEVNLAASQDPTSYPPFGQIASLRDAFPEVAGHETVGVEVESALIWAFVAVTNNETQHVTVIAPQ